jgi:hypothetical protein
MRQGGNRPALDFACTPRASLSPPWPDSPRFHSKSLFFKPLCHVGWPGTSCRAGDRLSTLAYNVLSPLAFPLSAGGESTTRNGQLIRCLRRPGQGLPGSCQRRATPPVQRDTRLSVNLYAHRSRLSTASRGRAMTKGLPCSFPFKFQNLLALRQPRRPNAASGTLRLPGGNRHALCKGEGRVVKTEHSGPRPASLLDQTSGDRWLSLPTGDYKALRPKAGKPR